MHPEILAALSGGDRLIARHEALDLGLTPSRISTLLRRESWVPIGRGMYADGEYWRSLDPYVGRQRLLARAATRRMQRRWVLSHDSAAHELGLAILCPDDPLVHVTRPGYTSAWTRYGVKHHLAAYRRDQVRTIDGLEVMGPARTAVDIARERGETDGVVACDSAMRMGVTRAELAAALEPMRHWPGVIAARVAVDLADPGAQNVHESLGRMFVTEAGFGRPETQFPLQTAEGVIWCDLRIGNHVVETDGRLKYRSRADGGVAEKPLGDVIWDEKKRERLIRAEGLGVSRILWADYWGERRARALEALRCDVQLTIERYGSDLPARLVRQAAELRARHARPA